MDTKDITSEELRIRLLSSQEELSYKKESDFDSELMAFAMLFHKEQSTQMRDRIEELEAFLPKINSVVLYLQAHPDNEMHSECADRLDDLIEIQTALNNKEK